MTKRTGRTHASSLKAKVALALKDKKTLADWARQYDGHPNGSLPGRPVWSRGLGRSGLAGATSDTTPAVGVKTLHTKIGRGNGHP